jgi:phage terminase large subunit
VGGWYNVIDYLDNHQRTIEWYLIQLQNKGYVYGTDWVPHDSTDTIIHSKLGGDKSRSIEMLIRNAGRTVRIAPKLHVYAGINATRTVFPQCRFDAAKCADGLSGLKHYQWGAPNAKGEARREPLHNWSSHPADAFRVLGTSIKAQWREEERIVKPPPRRMMENYAPFG